MATNVKELMAVANAVVPKITPEQAQEIIAKRGAVVIDVRDFPEVEASGKIKSAIHISRGMLEFRADADTPYHDKALSKDKPIIVYCASGGRAALSGKMLKDFGYTEVYNLGAFKDWVASGGEVVSAGTKTPQ